MDFKPLHYVLAIAEKRSISAAARQLGISQPSLTNYLHNLTGQLGVDLFERNESGFVPTYAGERYIASARQMLVVAGELKNIVPRAQERVIRVTCPPFEGSYIHPFAIRRFREIYPEVNILMLETNDMAELLRSGQADVAVTSSVLPGKDFVYRRLVRDEILLVTAKDHPVGKHAVWRENCSYPWVDINLLHGESFILLFPYQRTRMLSDALLERERIVPRVLMQTRSVLTSIRVASTGAGVCFAPAVGMKFFRFHESPAFYSVGDPIVMDVNFAQLDGVQLSEEAEKFVALVTNFAR